MKKEAKEIFKRIRKYNTIVIARHVGPDPDAIASQIALRDTIRLTFPNKTVIAVGAGVAKFRHYGTLDKLSEELDLTKALLIVTDLPNLARIDGANPASFAEIIKIDHHPFEEKMGPYDITDETASSSCEMIANLIFETSLVINAKIAKNLYLGIVSDSGRFLFVGTTTRTFETIIKLIDSTNLDFIATYPVLYNRPLAEIRFHGYLSQNMEVSENGLGSIKIDKKIILEYGVDLATASNMVNDFNFINEVLIWVFITEDDSKDVYKINIRSRGPIINEIATHFNGGGHKFAAGARATTMEEIDELLKELDAKCLEYKESIKED